MTLLLTLLMLMLRASALGVSAFLESPLAVPIKFLDRPLQLEYTYGIEQPNRFNVLG